MKKAVKQVRYVDANMIVNKQEKDMEEMNKVQDKVDELITLIEGYEGDDLRLEYIITGLLIADKGCAYGKMGILEAAKEELHSIFDEALELEEEIGDVCDECLEREMLNN